MASLAGCARSASSVSVEAAPNGSAAASDGGGDAGPPRPSSLGPSDAAISDASDAGAATATWSPPPAATLDGPYEDLALDAGRPIYYAARRGAAPPVRLVGHLHGMCGPPPYACGRWIGAGTEVGLMVCPTGNARCGESPMGPPSWEAPTWPELVAIMDHDLESAVAKVDKRRGGAFVRKEGAVLTGYSRGAFAAPVIARAHPGRWPYLVLIEANAPLSADSLRKAGVRAVALVAGDQGTEIAGMRKSEQTLVAGGLPARLFVMRHTGHLYSDDMEDVMHAALDFVLAHEAHE